MTAKEQPVLLDDAKLTAVVQQIIRNVAALSESYLSARAQDRSTIIKNLKESYMQECQEAGHKISIDVYIECITMAGIGWEWVKPDQF